MGSYAKYQERMRRAREQMKRRKTVNIGKEVMTGMYIYNTTKYLFYYIPNIISLTQHIWIILSLFTGKLNQTRLYSFMDEPAIEDRIDQILSLTVREEMKLKAAQEQLKKNQDSISVLAFFWSLDAVRALEREARGKLI